MNAHLSAIRAAHRETSQQRGDRMLIEEREDRERRRLDGYRPLYGYPTGYVSNPVTGSTLAFYANGMSFETSLPCCDHCDKPLDDHGYCPACEVQSVDWGVDADWAGIGRSLNAIEADRARANAAIDAGMALARGRAA